ncbi:hypothetical protein DQQ10_21515 [Pseudochryseolinea flava]|uniref:Uncharacterized protein n=1 Tax=Pseudochryseolinea flava TaxID=2059302 RepID=A0A364XYK3_9BACT|nr:hypothetical protein DQQ10_21515 [Pseudochryseolinea flava]
MLFASKFDLPYDPFNSKGKWEFDLPDTDQNFNEGSSRYIATGSGGGVEQRTLKKRKKTLLRKKGRQVVEVRHRFHLDSL